MLSVLVAAAIFIGGSHANAAPVPAESVLYPFTSDGCSLWPDGWPGINDTQWQQCCIKHDFRYYVGGTRSEKFAADNELRRCVAKSGHGFTADVFDNIMGGIIEFGVAAGGEAELPTSW